MNFRSSIPKKNLQAIQSGTMRYHWKGVHCCKNPFDLALYSMLLWSLRPKTIFEIGTKEGGSALWFRDITRSFDLDTIIFSVDINQRAEILFEGIMLLEGNAADLSPTLDKYLDSPHPWLIVEDSSHMYGDTLAVLEYFSSHLESGDYIVVEDGICNTFGHSHRYKGGPSLAIRNFLKLHSEFEIDRYYCNFYGKNVTWNPNGYLRRK